MNYTYRQLDRDGLSLNYIDEHCCPVKVLNSDSNMMISI